MRRILLTCSITFITIVCFSQSVINKKLNFAATNLSINEALIKLSEESQINIAYSNSILPTDVHVDMQVRQQAFKQVLRSILEDTNISFKLVSKQVILFRENTKELETININGYIEDADTGEKLVGANIYNPNNAYGTDSNEYGYFNFYGVPEVDSVFISYLGYETQKLLVSNNNSTDLVVKLQPSFFETIVVTAGEDTDDFLKRPKSGVDRLDLSAIQSVTSIGGEPDLFQAAYQLGGINSGADGVGGLHVRGGNLDQNLILLDGAPIYRPEHAIGILSVFNSDAIRSAKVYKGNFPSKYGGRLSSVMDIQTKEGNNQTYSGKLTLGLLTAKASFQGPIIKDNASFFVSFRRSLTDLYVPKLSRIVTERDSIDGSSNYSFYDLNAKANFRIGKSDRFYLSYYEGEDDFFNSRQQPEFRDSFPTVGGELLPGTFREGNTETLSWGNKMGSIRWNHIFGDRIFANTTAYLTNFKFFSNSEFRSEGVYDIGREDLIYLQDRFRSEVRDVGVRTDIEFLQSDRVNFKFGAGVINHRLKPGSSLNKDIIEDIPDPVRDSINAVLLDSLELVPIEALEGFAYYESGISLNRQLYLTLGLHARFWGSENFNHSSILPRFGIDFQLNDAISLSASYMEMIQYIHLLTKSDIGLPGDIWVPATENVAPEQARLVQLGMQIDLKKKWEFSTTAYYKEMDNLVEFLDADSTNILNALNYESKVTQGQGTSKGVEFEIRKTGKKFNGRMNYTLSKTDRQFALLNNGKTYPYRFDLRHMFNISGVYKLSRGWSLNANWIYNSGINLTLPKSKFGIETEFIGVLPIFIFSEKNEIRLPANQRLDIGANFHYKGDLFTHNLTIGIYNAYNHTNPIYIKLRRDPTDRANIQFVSVSLLPIIPSLSYSISF